MQKTFLLLSFFIMICSARAQQVTGHPATLAQDNTVIPPYIPLRIQGDSLVSLLGRKIRLNQQGFPEQIQTFFTPEMTDTSAVPNNLLAENIHFHFTRQSDGKDIRLKNGGLNFTLRSPDKVQWKASGTSEELQMDVNGSLEFEGFVSYTVKVTALEDLSLKEITMHIPFQKEFAPYMIGLGQKGGYRPDSMYQWKWDVAHKNQDGAWIGAVNAGLQYSLRDERQQPLLLPASWVNEGKGGISIGIKGKSMLANNYSGARVMKKGESLYYNFILLITPFHTLDTDFQWTNHIDHKDNGSDTNKHIADLYMKDLPYPDRLGLSEHFDYQKSSPDLFLTQVSGIPFGLMGEMPEGGGNPWRGLVYGMTNRMSGTGNSDPRPIWKIWNKFGMQGTKMIGYWSPSCPVKTDQEKILATVYEKKGGLLVSVASWADRDTIVRLQIDWEKIGIDPAKATIEAPEMKNFQPHRIFRPGEVIPVQKGKGWLLVVR